MSRLVLQRSFRHSRKTLGMAGLLLAVMTAGSCGSAASSSTQASAVSAAATASPSAPAPSGPTQLNPAMVPQGELALESKVRTPFTLGNAGALHVFSQGAEVTVEHFQFTAAGTDGATSGWHAHSGPVFLVVLTGTLTLYEATDPKCVGKQYPAGTGFEEPGFGNVHDARNEGSVPVEIYDTVVLPPGSGDNGIFIPKPDHSNPHCPFAK